MRSKLSTVAALTLTVSVSVSISSAMANYNEDVSTIMAQKGPFPFAKEDAGSTDIIGRHLVSQAHRVDEADWLSGYSLKFQGCRQFHQWNEDAYGAHEVKFVTKRLVRFRLCPMEHCSSNKAAGCDSGYGDYILDLTDFLELYWEGAQQKCREYFRNNCDGREDDGRNDDAIPAEPCAYQCFANNKEGSKMDAALRTHKPADDEKSNILQNYGDCREFLPANHKQSNNQEWFIGPYCAEQEGAIYMGLFSDNTCTVFIPDDDIVRANPIFHDLIGGDSLPFSDTSIVSSECISCGDNDAFKDLYLAAGKCEAELPSSVVDYPNTNACDYIKGIMSARRDGTFGTIRMIPSSNVNIYIVIFACLFFILIVYTHRLSRDKRLLEETVGTTEFGEYAVLRNLELTESTA